MNLQLNSYLISELEQLLSKKLIAAGYHFDNIVLHKMAVYLFLLKTWSRAYNLTTVIEPEAMITRHILDSLAIKDYLQGPRIIDVGTGAGLPGLPLALACPELQFYLLESNYKKIAFLNHVMMQLKLKNLVLLHTRVERYHPPECFNSIVTRAFSAINDMLTLTKHLCCINGRFLAMKGLFPTAELADLPSQFILDSVVSLQVSGLCAERHLVIIKFLQDAADVSCRRLTSVGLAKTLL